MRLLVALAACALYGQDPKALVERALERAQIDDDMARHYTYLETSVEQEWKDGKRTKAETQTYEILNLYGQPHRRLVARDGKPLDPAEQQKQQQKLDRTAADRAKETPAERERRLAKYREERRKSRAFLNQIPNAFDFRMAGETVMGGRAAWILEATPRPDFRGRDAREKMLSKFKGRFYIAKSEPALLKLEAEAIDTVSFGLVLARLEKGARFTMEKTKVNGELWMPVRMKVDFDARLALFKKMKVDLQIDYTNFRKFQSESRVLSQE
jgi:hypothetical protein